MAKIKITTLSDRMKDDEILSKLKSIGVKIKDKDKEKEEQSQKEVLEKTTASGDTVVEKRVASTVIRRRVQRPPQEAEKQEEPAVEIKETPSPETIREKEPSAGRTAAKSSAAPAKQP